MGISSSLSTALDALKRNPVLFVAAFAVSLVSTVLLGAQLGMAAGRSPFVYSMASFLVQFVALFFVGGAYAMADEALDGRTRLGTLLAGGKDNYVSLLGATLLLVGVTMATFIAIAVLVLVVFIGAATTMSPGALGPAFALVAAIYLLGFLPIFFLQFYGPAVVVSDAGAVGSLKRSVGVVRRNLLATLGFDAVAFVLGLIGSAPTVWLYATNFDQLTATTGSVTPLSGLGASAVAGYLVSTLVFSTLFGGFFYTYQVAFYDDLTDRDAGDGRKPTTAGDDGTPGDETPRDDDGTAVGGDW